MTFKIVMRPDFQDVPTLGFALAADAHNFIMDDAICHRTYYVSVHGAPERLMKADDIRDFDDFLDFIDKCWPIAA